MIRSASSGQAKEEENGQWDKKKIIITTFFSIVAILIAGELKGKFLDNRGGVLGESIETKPVTIQKPDVKPPNFNVVSQVGSRIEDIKDSINGLDAVEIASSSPQIQKVLRDIQGIKDLPANQAKEMCLKICSGI